MFRNDDWLALVQEPIIDPDRGIVDPHHHLWENERIGYDLDELWGDTGSGHNITHTIFVECGSNYLKEGDEHLRCVGETKFVAQRAMTSAQSSGKSKIAAIVSHADLTSARLDEILDAHEEAGAGFFRGIRHAGAYDPHPEDLAIPGRAPVGLYKDASFRAGLARLGERSLSYDTWHYHHQNRDFIELARAVPNTILVLDHFGTPLGVGRFAGKRKEIFETWQEDMTELAKCPNVFAKLGGLAMIDNGFEWHSRKQPPGSDEFVKTQAPYYHHMIKCFGAQRCMFESNFPVDRLSVSYQVLWNALKKIARSYSEEEQNWLFSQTAWQVYKLN